MSIKHPIFVKDRFIPNPLSGMMYFDPETSQAFLYDGSNWIVMAGRLANRSLEPTDTELENESLKSAWEQYLVVRKLLGL